MGAYDSNPGNEAAAFGREARSPWSGAVGVGNLAERLGGLGVGDSPMDSLFQVMKAVEDAENTIKQQEGFGSMFLTRSVLCGGYQLVWPSFYSIGIAGGISRETAKVDC